MDSKKPKTKLFGGMNEGYKTVFKGGENAGAQAEVRVKVCVPMALLSWQKEGNHPALAQTHINLLPGAEQGVGHQLCS